MDTALSGGDFLKSSNGHPVYVSNIEELLQRALIRLCVKKGSFIYDRELGSELYKLRNYYSDIQTLEEMALEKVTQALQAIPQLSVTGVELNTTNGGERLELNVLLKANGTSTNLEVKI